MNKFNFLILAALMPTIPMMAEDSKIPAGVNPANIDTSVSPRVDFYDYACGGWMKANPIGDEYSRFGSFDQLAENNRLRLKELFTTLETTPQTPGTNGQKVADLYKLGLDSVRLNKEGAAPVKEDLAKIAKMTKADINKMIAWEHATIGSPFFGCGVEADLMNSDINTLYINQPGVSLPDRDYYLEATAENKKIQAKYKEYLQKLFVLAGYKTVDAKRAATNIYNLEYKLAEMSWDRVQLRDYSKQYNIYTLDKLQSEFPSIDWANYFKTIGVNNIDKVIVCQPDVIQKVSALISKMTLQEIKDYLSYEILSSASNYLSDDFVKLNFDMFSRTIAGTKEMQPRWKRALSVPNGMLGEAVGELYVDKYFPPSSKERMLKLVNNLKVALGEHIAALPWMTPKTKVNALVKLNSFTVKIGYPDKWKDYSKISINPEESYWTNVKKALTYLSQENIEKYGKPVDKDEWGMTPQTVNAYYNPTTNEICFPAGILQPPFFDANADDASNYGAIGVVIGHEMTHGFDDQGRNFDQNGNMVDWWTAEDAQKFAELTKVLKEQYDNIIVNEEGMHANGEFTLGENIADHGGLRVSYSAFKKTEQGKSNEKIDGFTPDQRFYLAYAGVWAGNIRPAEIVRRTKTDPHSLGRWRVNAALKNIQPFYDAFSIVEGDPMYLAPEKRVEIW